MAIKVMVKLPCEHFLLELYFLVICNWAYCCKTWLGMRTPGSVKSPMKVDIDLGRLKKGGGA
jgi:hypothetical protein